MIYSSVIPLLFPFCLPLFYSDNWLFDINYKFDIFTNMGVKNKSWLVKKFSTGSIYNGKWLVLIVSNAFVRGGFQWLLFFKFGVLSFVPFLFGISPVCHASEKRGFVLPLRFSASRLLFTPPYA